MIQTHNQATAFLIEIDTDWKSLIETIGTCTLRPKTEQEPYEALIRAVAYQQLSTRVGDAILQRFLRLYNLQFPSPQQLLASEFLALRACGFSGRKIETLQGIAEATISGLVPSRSDAEHMGDEALISQISTLKGIGRWTVEMMLMFNLGRLDVLPADDLGIKEGYKRMKSLYIAPTSKEMKNIAMVWKPYRSIAAWYLWRVPR